MNRAELEHVIQAAHKIVGGDIVVIGSQAVLRAFPDAPQAMLRSPEADVYPRDEPERAIEIDGAIGVFTMFHDLYGYYAHGVGPETPHAPAGWEGRMLKIQVPPMMRGDDYITAWFLEIHDLALSKLAAGREKDFEFVIEALRARLIDRDNLERGVPLMPEADREPVRERVQIVLSRVA